MALLTWSLIYETGKLSLGLFPDTTTQGQLSSRFLICDLGTHPPELWFPLLESKEGGQTSDSLPRFFVALRSF